MQQKEHLRIREADSLNARQIPDAIEIRRFPSLGCATTQRLRPENTAFPTGKPFTIVLGNRNPTFSFVGMCDDSKTPAGKYSFSHRQTIYYCPRQVLLVFVWLSSGGDRGSHVRCSLAHVPDRERQARLRAAIGAPRPWSC
jgi:hypothetical protein